MAKNRKKRSAKSKQSVGNARSAKYPALYPLGPIVSVPAAVGSPAGSSFSRYSIGGEAEDSNSEDYEGREVVALEDGSEVAYYDPTAAIEEYADSRASEDSSSTPDDQLAAKSQKTIGGLLVDEGMVLEPDEQRRTTANSASRVVAVPKRGEEEVFAHLEFAVVLPTAAGSVDEAMSHARRHLKRAGLTPSHFLSFDITTHYYLGTFGKRECGWSFLFESKPFSPEPRMEPACT